MWAVLDEQTEPESDSRIVVEPTRSVVVALRDLSRLEGTVFHIERVIDLKDKQTRLRGLIEVEDAILLVASGDVTAGVDLERMRADDIQADPERGAVHIVLPPVEVLSTRIDNRRTYVHTRSTDTLARRNENLETRARREAEATLAEAALEAGLLPRAQSSVLATVEALVRSLGYREVEIEFRGPEQER